MTYIRKGNPINPESFLKNVEFSHTRKNRMMIDGDEIKLHSDRYKCFKNSGLKCVSCGIEGKHFFKEKHETEKGEVYHLNLYAVDEMGNEIMMTKDHRVPKSKGGKNHWSNYDTMCINCNSEKANSSKHVDAMIEEAIKYCDEEEKSTEFLLQYAQDASGADLDYVLDYIMNREIGRHLTSIS